MNDRPEIIEHYTAAEEQSRLAGATSLERLRTQLILDRVLPTTPSRVLDVGGGAGIYAAWLAERGHSVHLVDPVPKHVQQAGAIGTFTAAVGDAVDLDEPDGSCDAVLLLGPLYHLIDRSQRLRALHEARRVARAGGLIAVAAISRYASLMDGFYLGFIADQNFVDIVADDLRTGHHRNPTLHPRYFTTAYFHTCAELHSEIADAGFEDIQILPVEGLLAWSPILSDVLADPERRSFALHCIQQTETDPAVVAASPHLLAVARVLA
jgi:SAM-dependent methyltransferase